MSKTFLMVCLLSNTYHEPVARFDFQLVEHIDQWLAQHILRNLKVVLEAPNQDLM